MFRSRECNLHLSIITAGFWSGFLSLKSVRLKTGAGGSIQSFSPNNRLVGFFKRPSRGNFDPVRFYLKACGVPLSEIAPEMNKYLAWNPFQRETSLYISELVSPFSVATTRRLLNSMLPKSYLAARWEWENCKVRPVIAYLSRGNNWIYKESNLLWFSLNIKLEEPLGHIKCCSF